MKPSDGSRSRIRVQVCGVSIMGTALLADALDRCRGIRVVGKVTEPKAAFDLVAKRKPSVAVIGGMMNNESAKSLRLCRELHASYPEIKVVMVSDFATAESVATAVRSGATGLFSQGESIEALAECIRSVNTGHIWARDRELKLAFEGLSKLRPVRFLRHDRMALLTERERLVVQCVAEGLSNREIAARLQLSGHTIKNYLFRIFDKLGISSRVELVLYAFSRTASETFDADPAVRSGSKNGPSSSDEEHPNLYQGAAELGITAAQFRLAESYRVGNGVPRDCVASYKWYLVAEAMGAAISKSSRAEGAKVQVEMDDQQIDEAKSEARRWLERNSRNGKLLCPSRQALVEAHRILSKIAETTKKLAGPGTAALLAACPVLLQVLGSHAQPMFHVHPPLQAHHVRIIGTELLRLPCNMLQSLQHGWDGLCHQWYQLQ